MAEQGTGASSSSELELARKELAALEGAVEALPQILEDKFRQRLLALRQFNHQLELEQASLRNQMMASQRAVGVPWRMVLVAALVCTGLAGLGWSAARTWGPGSMLSLRLPDASRPAVPVSSSILQVQARDSSWVEVQDLRTQEVLFIGVLEAGQSRTIRLRQGLRLRSGRPDLLTLRIDDGPAEPFGQSQGHDWRAVMPPALRTAGA